MNISWGGYEEQEREYTLKISEEEKKLLDEAIWYQISILATLKDLGGFKNDEEKEFELYKSIYKKLGNELETWVEEALNMSIRIAMLLQRLGFAITMDGDKHKIVIKRDK